VLRRYSNRRLRLPAAVRIAFNRAARAYAREGMGGLDRRGSRIGPPSAVLSVVEFGDYQCPFCATFHAALRDLMNQFPDSISLTYYHFPLPTHRFAVDAARAAHCAERQGRFEHMTDVLFASQDSIGHRSWTRFAQLAGVSDTAALLQCMTDSLSLADVRADKELGERLDVAGTPTVILNGWRYPLPPNKDSLQHIFTELGKGASPFPRRRG